MGDEPILSVADVSVRTGLPARTIWTYVHRRRYDKSGHTGIPLPDAPLADRPGWLESTIRPWLEGRE